MEIIMKSVHTYQEKSYGKYKEQSTVVKPLKKTFSAYEMIRSWMWNNFNTIQTDCKIDEFSVPD